MVRSALPALLVLTLVACAQRAAPSSDGGAASTEPARALTVKGSDTLVILVQRWAEEFMKARPEAKVQVTGGGSGTGLAALINNATDIAMSSRSIKKAETEKIAAQGDQVVETVVAKDGVTFFVHESNPVSSLTREQLELIYLGDLTNWKDVGGPDAQIIVYSRENSSGTFAYVRETVLRDQDFAPQVMSLPGTGAVVNAISQEPFGIGYGGAGFAKGIKELKIRVGDEEIAPTLQNIQQGRYPLARDLFFYTRGKPEGVGRQLVDFALSPQGQALVKSVGYFPVK